MANDDHDGRPPVDEPREGGWEAPRNAPRVDPLGRTERYGFDPGTEPPRVSDMMGPRPASVGGAEAERARHRLLELMFPGEANEPPKIDTYVIQEHVGVGGLIGQGGMGLVYAVWDAQLERMCAAKLVRGVASDEAVARAMREACLLAKFDHANIVKVHAGGVTRDGEFYIIMEHVPGVTLDVWQREARPWRELLEVYLLAGRGLAEAHGKNVIHRDFKPKNVMVEEPRAAEPTLAPQDRSTVRRVVEFVRKRMGPRAKRDAPARKVRVLDFGLAAWKEPEIVPPLTARQVSPHTKAGARMGTVGYMPPEQIRGRPADAQSDQFSFCVSLYEGLFGCLPFGPLPRIPYDPTTATMMARTYEARVECGEIDVPIGLRGAPARLFHDVLRRGLAPDPKLRFPSMAELLAALEHELHRGERIRRRVALGGSVALGGVLGWLLLQTVVAEDPCLAVGERLARAWDPDRQAEHLRLAVPDESVRAQVVRRLDRFKSDWTEQRMRVCQAETQLGSAADLDGAVECLDDHLRVFEGMVGGLVEGSAVALLDLAELADKERLAECKSASVAARPRRSPEMNAQASAIRSLLAQAEARLLLADYPASRDAAEQALQAAGVLGEPRLLARAFNQAARARTYALDRPEVVPLLERAAELAERHELHDIAADVYLRRLRLAALAEPPNEAEARAFDAMLRATLHRLGTAGQREADRLLYMAKLETSLGRLDAAEKLAERAEDLSAEASPFQRGRVLDVIAGIAYRRKQYDVALRRFEDALRLREQELGSLHPRLLSALVGLALTRIRREEYVEADAQVKRARALMARLPHDPIDAVYVHTAAAMLADARGDTRAIPDVHVGLALVDRMGLGEVTRARELDLVDVLLSLSYQAQDREGVLAMCRRIHGYLPLHREKSGLDYILSRGGIAASEYGEHALANELLSAATPGTAFRPLDVVEFHLSLARTRLALGQPGVALGEADKVLRMPPGDVDEALRVEARTIYSRALAQLSGGEAR